jgi:L-ornithine N5-oxygenase
MSGTFPERITMSHPRNPEVGSDRQILDILGVGFGPSNLSLAIAVAEHNAGRAADEQLTTGFVERQDRFGWHRGMLLEDATMRVSFLKDLVTLRNPTSPFSFLSYLHDRDRLVDFINYGTFYPTRIEFHDYFEWAAARFDTQVHYGCEVIEIGPGTAGPDGRVEHVEVLCREGGAVGGETFRLRARNLVLATGLAPSMPTGVSMGPRIWHNCDLLHRLPELKGTEPERIVVVGAGQSAAEAVDYLHRMFPASEVCAVFARYGYSPADDSSFANRIFDPTAVDDYYAAPDAVKELILGYHANTNYSVVDPDLIDGLFRRHYHEMVAGKPRLRFLNVSRIADVAETDECVELAVDSLIHGEREVLNADLVVYATGYRAGNPLELLTDELKAAVHTDDAGRTALGRDYRVATEQGVLAGVYLQGPTEHTHGISSTLLSNMAVRSGEILSSVLAGRPASAATEPLVRVG